LEAGVGPPECGVDCAHLWSGYASGCGTFLGRVYPGFEAFSGLCATTSGEMTVLEYDGHLDEGQSDDHDFTAQQELVYDIEEVPSTAGPARTSLAIEAPHSHHVLADRVDISRHGAGEHHIEWDAPETEAGVDINVESLEGSGDSRGPVCHSKRTHLH
jgi:hypothetical protein